MSDPQPLLSLDTLDTLAAEDLRALAWLHDREREPLALIELHGSGFPKTLSLLPASDEAVVRMDEALAALDGIDPQALADCADDLAADYAGIYLTHRLRAAPTESVWHDEEQLVMQAPTFAVREFYARHGMLVENWRHQPDDHLVHQLRFIAVLLERGEKKEAARFARTHLMTWLPRFTAQVEKLARTRLYASLATLTLECMKACLQRLPQVAIIPPVSVVTPPAGTPACGSGRPQ